MSLVNKGKQRPKKNKIYLHYHYRDDGREQCMDMLFWNEKFLNELFVYSRLDDGIPRILEIVEAYKERLKERGITYDEYLEYVQTKIKKIKEIVEINERWACIEQIGISDFNDLVLLGEDKKRIDQLMRELGTFKELLREKEDDVK